jgi:hypothetical protein
MLMKEILTYESDAKRGSKGLVGPSLYLEEGPSASVGIHSAVAMLVRSGNKPYASALL